MYSPFSLIWLMTNDFQVEFFSFNYQKQWKLSVCKKVINQVRVNGLKTTAKFYFLSVTGCAKNITVIETILITRGPIGAVKISRLSPNFHTSKKFACFFQGIFLTSS